MKTYMIAPAAFGEIITPSPADERRIRDAISEGYETGSFTGTNGDPIVWTAAPQMNRELRHPKLPELPRASRLTRAALEHRRDACLVIADEFAVSAQQMIDSDEVTVDDLGVIDIAIRHTREFLAEANTVGAFLTAVTA